jgi:hypothetical protein
MIKKFIITACLLLSLVTFAQQGSSSPYSFYGIGDVRFKGTLESRSMAGVNLEQDSIHINLENPASYSNLKFTTFALGGTYATTTLKTSSKSESARRSTLDYLAVGLPMGKFGVGFGLIPYSSVGYSINTDATAITNQKVFTGTGGLNKIFVGAGYQVNPKFCIGADMAFNFGKVETNSSEKFTDNSVTSETNLASIRGVNFNIGSMFQTKINKKNTFYSSLNFTLASTLNSNTTRTIETSLDVLDPISLKSELKIPTKITFGAGIGETRKWLIGTQIAMRGAGTFASDYNNVANVSYEKYTKFSIGGYYIPNYNSFSNYLKKITYRAGFKYEKTGLVIRSESINDVGITLGIGMPISQSLSNFNFGFEIGKRGTTTAGLIQENYANLSVSFSLNDKWFVQRKYN